MLEDDFDLTSESHKNFLIHVLGIFDKSLENVFCLVGDNCSTNTHLADLCGLPFVGCASHRFNLEVQAYLGLPQFEQLVEKVLLFGYHFRLFILSENVSVICIVN
jgi:hypothetical protein